MDGETQNELGRSLLSQRDNISDDDDPSAELRRTRRGKATRTFREDQGMVTTLLAKHNKQSAPVAAYMSRVGSSLIVITFSIIFLISAIIGITSFVRTYDAQEISVTIYKNSPTNDFQMRPEVFLCYHKTSSHNNVKMKQKCIDSKEGKAKNQCTQGSIPIHYSKLPVERENLDISRLMLGADKDDEIQCRQFASNYTEDGRNILAKSTQYVEFNILQDIKYSVFNESNLNQLIDINDDAPEEFFSPSQIMLVMNPQVQSKLKGNWYSAKNGSEVFFLSSMAKVDIMIRSVGRMYRSQQPIPFLPFITFKDELFANYVDMDKTEHQLGAFGYEPICDASLDKCFSRTIIRLFLSKAAVLRDEKVSKKNVFSIIYYFGGTIFMFYLFYLVINWVLQHSLCLPCYRSKKQYDLSERRKQLAEDVVSATELA
mmetsp:Transcript_10355/g.15142  ORF Transcript_10355/g.15142 Transcript_10355/m.15142 type:complete len:429 (+) Transcript_10355:161-1447(+)